MEIFGKYAPVVRQYWLPLLLAAFGMIFLGYSLIGLLSQKKDNPDILFESASTTSSDTTDTTSALDDKNTSQKTIVVDVEGAVQKPGVYKLPADSRIQDALIAAQGLGKDADRQKLAKNLNLASKLTDGTKIYISYLGDSTNLQSPRVQSSETGSGNTGLIDINSASAGELDSLPGIGRTTADKIINNRPYQKIEELLDKKIVGKKVFTDIEGKITIN